MTESQGKPEGLLATFHATSFDRTLQFEDYFKNVIQLGTFLEGNPLAYQVARLIFNNK